MAKSANLGAAKNAKQDEFYTQLSDIEKEMRHYRRHFKDKTILCNCDDPFESNFFKFFVLNFNRLGLKKVIATCYSGSPIAGKQLSLFDVLGDSAETRNKPYKAVVTSVYDKTGDGGAFEVGTAPAGSAELERLIAAARSEADELARIGGWAAVRIGFGGVETIDCETGRTVYAAGAE